jgi:diacylglycerol kinase (ATP)
VTVVVLNPAAGNGTARARFSLVREHIGPHDLIEITSSDSWQQEVHDAASKGIRRFIAAGGDGTVHALVNALAGSGRALSGFELGAIGLGSSNDFHKPVSNRMAGIPARLGPPHPRDVVQIEEDGRSRLMVVSASLGVTADANAAFNSPGPLVRALKARFTDLAIVVTAISTIAQSQKVRIHLDLGTESYTGDIANVSILLTQWVSGVFRYDLPIEPGKMTIALVPAIGRIRLLGTLARLSRHQFTGRWWTTRRLAINLDSPHVLEIDGEVTPCLRPTFSVIDGAINTCA